MVKAKCATCQGAGWVKRYVFADGPSTYDGDLILDDKGVRWLGSDVGYELAYCPACGTVAGKKRQQEAA